MNTTLKLSLSSRVVALVIFGLAVIVAGAGWFVVVSPKRSQATKLAQSIQEKQSQLTAAQHTGRSTLTPQGPTDRGVNEALPNDVAMPSVVDQLNRLARRAGVSLDTVTPQPTVFGSGYVAVPLNVVVDGRYFDVDRFLNLVRTQVRVDKNHVAAAGRLFDVQSVQLQQTEPAPTVTATLTLQTFYYSQTAAPAPTDTTATTTSDTTS